MTPMSDADTTSGEVRALVERLRARAESEREIQRNNEAVAAALSGQMEAFRRRDGTHNTFAVRLGLDHQNCAKRDAALAADWDDAADMLEHLSRLLLDPDMPDQELRLHCGEVRGEMMKGIRIGMRLANTRMGVRDDEDR